MLPLTKCQLLADDCEIMPLHQLPEGLQVIESLEALGESLDYVSSREHTVGRTGAAVDLAWFGAGDQRVPLMIFEVESSASASMVNNAMKVFSQDVDDFVKPLFFFHILLGGGPDNERIAGMRRTWGTYNYRVYRFNDESEVQRLVSDILGQHRRVISTINLPSLASALRSPSWSKVNLVDVFEVAENLQFSANYLLELAYLAPDNPSMQPLFTARLRRQYLENEEYPGSYGAYIGSNFAPILEIPLLVGTEAIRDEQGVELLAEWQQGWGGSLIGPLFGLSRQYDDFIIGGAPLIYAAAAALCRKSRLTKAWIVKELSGLIDSEDEVNVQLKYTTAARIWLLHITASTIRDFSSCGQGSYEADLHQIYERTRSSVHMTRVPLDLLRVPPSPSELVGEDAEPLPIGELSAMRQLVNNAEWADLNNGYFPEVEQDDWFNTQPELCWRNPFDLAVGALAGNKWISWPTNHLVRLLHGELFPDEHSSVS
jgi:hypothetical protein